MYKPVDPRVSFPRMEEQILAFWRENNTFQRSIDNRKGAPEFMFYDGPPFATGLPHFGHFSPGTVKDIFPRYQTMKGKRVERRFGWDCHGLPVEYEMEKQLGISGKTQIEAYGVARFNEACRSIVLRYTAEWRKTVERMGRWVDFGREYRTMDPDYMETIWWVFKQLWDRGLIYQGYYILPYDPVLTTPLSNFEVNLGGYQEVDDPAITVRFRVTDSRGRFPLSEGPTWILAWTTTPWTLPSNLGLALGPDIEYVRIRDGGDYYILAPERIGHYYKNPADVQVVQRFKGSDLAGIGYEPLFPYFGHLAARGAFRTHNAAYVTTEDGSGVVHIAPGFGEEDYEVFRGTGMPVVCPVDAECRFTDEVPDYKGTFVKDADAEIIRRLRAEGKLVRRETYRHPYPFSYRSKSPLIYRAVSSWFVSIEQIKERMLRTNGQINWVPAHLKEGRFGKWLEGARDWAISRNRYWGNPIPIWQSDRSDYRECIGSVEELEAKSGVRVQDLHKHFVDDITWPAPDGGTMRRIPEVLDCWFESGAMPYAQSHYPFENKEHFDSIFPADFICESLDQTRGWFYTLHVLAAALFEKPAFLNCVVGGMVLDAQGKKMSKSERNYTDPAEVIDKYGADALRLALMDSAVVRAEDFKYSDEAVSEVLKNVLIPMWNSYSFFVTYANIDGARPTGAPASPANPLDRWILSEMDRLVAEVTTAMDAYELQKAIDPIVAFVDLLNNWYIRRSRRRFWKSENDADKAEAYGTLYAVLKRLALLAAPVIPFVTEEIWRNLRLPSEPESVHLCDYPAATGSRDLALERRMALARRAVAMGRALRAMHNVKVRQPLPALHLVTRDPEERAILGELEEIVRDELNVKQVLFRENEEELVEYRAKANFAVLGKRLGKDMKAASERIAALGGPDIQRLLAGATVKLDLGGRSFDLTAEGVQVARVEKEDLKVLNEGSLTVALDVGISEDLRQEGAVRDLVRSVQSLRKQRGLNVTDRIRLYLHGSAAMREAVESYEEYLTSETLAVSWEWVRKAGAVEAACGEEKIDVDLEKVSV